MSTSSAVTRRSVLATTLAAAGTLAIGEYALVEIISPSDISQTVWDFQVNPRLGDNEGSIGPINRQ